MITLSDAQWATSAIVSMEAEYAEYLVTLMSPASICDSEGYRLRNAEAWNRVAPIRAPVFLFLGENDLRSNKKVVTRRLVPILQATNEGFEYRLDYPGEHSWFHQLRDDYWLDIAGFLGKHLK